MIKKLERYIREEDGVKISCPPTNEAIVMTVNTLVDAVNELAHTINNHKCQLNNHLCRLLALEDPDEPDDELPAENVQDPYAEQRKCICKLCWFWNDDKADKVIGILTGVFDEADRPFERNIDQTLYKHCEPVKPDDDIIYNNSKEQMLKNLSMEM